MTDAAVRPPDPRIAGLPLEKTYKGRGGDEVFLLLGMEIFTTAVWKGREVTPDTYNMARKLIMRAKAMEEALDMRCKKMGVEP